jgi:hypothetical protein
MNREGQGRTLGWRVAAMLAVMLGGSLSQWVSSVLLRSSQSSDSYAKFGSDPDVDSNTRAGRG